MVSVNIFFYAYAYNIRGAFLSISQKYFWRYCHDKSAGFYQR
nr:MAG TPA_asm: hypothetical protein [Bacteriophage sp.]